jgi:hypothetical protein
MYLTFFKTEDVIDIEIELFTQASKLYIWSVLDFYVYYISMFLWEQQVIKHLYFE